MNYVGQAAHYVTTSHFRNSAEVAAGTSDLKVISFNGATTYSVQITNTNVQGVAKTKTVEWSTTELENQSSGDLFQHCSERGGKIVSPLVIGGENHAACEMDNGNTNLWIGVVPFTILKSVSTAGDGTVYTTLLVSFKSAGW